MEMPVRNIRMKYSDGTESIRHYQGGQLVDVTWVRQPRRISSWDVVVNITDNATGKP